MTCPFLSSPRLWGWPVVLAGRHRIEGKFPTPVGMAGWCRERGLPVKRAPHVCRDDPKLNADRTDASASSPQASDYSLLGQRHAARMVVEMREP